MTVALLRHERDLRWELVEAIPPSVATTTVEMPVGSDIRSFLHRIDVRALVRMRSEREVPIRHRVAAAQLRASKCRVILATDRNIEFLNSLAELCPEVQQIIVGHGVLVPMLQARLRQTRSYPNRSFCVWGRRETELLKHYAPEGLDPLTLGSLRNAFYLSSLTSPYETETNPVNQICLVSSFVGKVKENQRRSRTEERWELREFLLECVRRLARAWSVPVVVALKPQTMYAYTEGASQKWSDEMSYFRSGLGECDLKFTEPEDKFASYQASDKSLLTVGVFASGSLLEGFGRGNLAMSVGIPRIDVNWGSLPASFHLTEMSLLELERQPISQLRHLREWLSSDSGRDAREFVLGSATDTSPILQIRSMIAQRLS